MWKNRLFLALAWVGRWLSLLAPIALVIWFNRDIYFKDQIATYKIFTAFAFAGAVIVPIIVKEVKAGLLVWLGIVLIMLALLKPILADLEFLLTVFTISYAVYKYIFTNIYNYLKKVCELELDANIKAKAMGKVMKQNKLEETTGRV